MGFNIMNGIKKGLGVTQTAPPGGS